MAEFVRRQWPAQSITLRQYATHSPQFAGDRVGFHTLGLDAQAQGAGLMHEALGAVIAQMFGAAVRLHRIQAAVRPENQRSRAVLQRLGFAEWGREPDFCAREDGSFDDARHWVLRANPTSA